MGLKGSSLVYYDAQWILLLITYFCLYTVLLGYVAMMGLPYLLAEDPEDLVHLSSVSIIILIQLLVHSVMYYLS